jgi:ribosomal protein S18 acetylase RimI-like enzyme
MSNIITYQKINQDDYEKLTKIMTRAFNDDTSIHTNKTEDGPAGYNDGNLIKWLNEQKNFESYKIIFNQTIVGAFTIGIREQEEYSIEMLFIDPGYRKYHLGTMVWNDIELKYNEAEKWLVETPDYSTRNHYFYVEKCGFRFLKENVCENGEKSFVFIKVK